MSIGALINQFVLRTVIDNASHIEGVINLYVLCALQIVILVVDSTDRERLTLTKEELHRMLAHEVQNSKRDVAAELTDVYYFNCDHLDLFTTKIMGIDERGMMLTLLRNLQGKSKMETAAALT